GLRVYDLRAALTLPGGDCAYQPRNMHWTAAGHQAVAAWLAGRLPLSGDKALSQLGAQEGGTP
ncbi:hypothetical protein ABTM86_19200, partial [Acinetobacter baumannii]